MPTATGLSSAFGIKTETTHATPVTVDKFLPFLNESIMSTKQQQVSQGLMSGRVTHDEDQAKYGFETIAGDIEMEIYAQTQGIIWKHLLGTVVDAGGGPFTHTCTPAGTLPSSTIQIATRDISDTSRAKTYAGCKVNAVNLSGSAGQLPKLKASIMGGLAETTATAAATVAYAANALFPMTWEQTTVSVNGSAVNCDSYDISFDNQLGLRPYAGIAVTAEPKRDNWLKCTGKLTLELEDLTEYNLYRNGTACDVVLTHTDGTYSTAVTIHTKFTGTTPTVKGPGRNLYDLTWDETFGDATDADAITVVYTDATATVG